MSNSSKEVRCQKGKEKVYELIFISESKEILGQNLPMHSNSEDSPPKEKAFDHTFDNHQQYDYLEIEIKAIRKT